MSDGRTEEARFTARYDAVMVRRAVRTFIWRRVFRTGWFIAGVMGPVAIALFGLSRSWRLGVEGGVGLLLLVAAVVVLVWRAHLQASLGRLQAMSPPEALVIVRPPDITFRSSLAEATIPWSTFTETWRLAGFWMLFTSPSAFNILPVEGLDPATTALLADRLPSRPPRTSGASPT